MAHTYTGGASSAIPRKGVSTGLHEFIVPQKSIASSKEVWKVDPTGKTMIPTRMQTAPALPHQQGFLKTPPPVREGISSLALKTKAPPVSAPASQPPGALGRYLAGQMKNVGSQASRIAAPVINNPVVRGIASFGKQVMQKGAPGSAFRS